MTNAEMIEELRKMSTSGDNLPAQKTNRLVLAAVASLIERSHEQDELRATQARTTEELKLLVVERMTKQDDQIKAIQEAIERLAKGQLETCLKVEEISKAQSVLKEVGELLNDNFLVEYGALITKYKWLGPLSVGALLIFLSLWFITDFRQAMLIAFGLPPSLVDWLQAPH